MPASASRPCSPPTSPPPTWSPAARRGRASAPGTPPPRGARSAAPARRCPGPAPPCTRWAAVGRTRPDVRGRVDHCIEVAERTRAFLADETSVQERVPLLIGGGNPRLLRWAAGHADLIGLTGLGRTLEDGHMHETRWRGD